ncbi:hypothetical protein M3Y95_00685000 [Aphelenchoides besseyi]|nr:hypothetical protein M3Y95_00685000 [Aphelenchoides besseyi]
MERIVLISAVLMAIIFELCSAAGAFAQQPNSRDPSSRVDEMVQREMAQINEAQYAANNLETIMQLLAERDAQESEWRRQEALDRENARAELAKQKRDFHYYGARGKKALASAFAEQKRFQYMPSRG